MTPATGPRLERLVSGGQTGVDRGALEAAIACGVPHGGWCPRGRIAEDGRIPERYALVATPSTELALRTEWNVRDSDGTLVLSAGAPAGGTALTVRLAARLGRPCLLLDLTADPDPARVREWLAAHAIRVLNVAGPRETSHPGIESRAADFLRRVLAPSPG